MRKPLQDWGISLHCTLPWNLGKNGVEDSHVQALAEMKDPAELHTLTLNVEDDNMECLLDLWGTSKCLHTMLKLPPTVCKIRLRVYHERH